MPREYKFRKEWSPKLTQFFSFSSSFLGKFFSSPNNENKQEAVGKQTIYKYPKRCTWSASHRYNSLSHRPALPLVCLSKVALNTLWTAKNKVSILWGHRIVPSWNFSFYLPVASYELCELSHIIFQCSTSAWNQSRDGKNAPKIPFPKHISLI